MDALILRALTTWISLRVAFMFAGAISYGHNARIGIGIASAVCLYRCHHRANVSRSAGRRMGAVYRFFHLRPPRHADNLISRVYQHHRALARQHAAACICCDIAHSSTRAYA